MTYLKLEIINNKYSSHFIIYNVFKKSRGNEICCVISDFVVDGYNEDPLKYELYVEGGYVIIGDIYKSNFYQIKVVEE